MEKIHLDNIIKSIILGLFIGVILQFSDNTNIKFSYRVLAILASGCVGFFIGLVTEWLTAILPISMANARTYFLINNLIALIVTTVIMMSLIIITNSEMVKKGEFISVLLIVLGIICLANLSDYMMYRRAQNKLRKFKAMIKDTKY